MKKTFILSYKLNVQFDEMNDKFKDSDAYVPVPLSTTPMKNMSVSFASPASDTCRV